MYDAIKDDAFLKGDFISVSSFLAISHGVLTLCFVILCNINSSPLANGKIYQKS